MHRHAWPAALAALWLVAEGSAFRPSHLSNMPDIRDEGSIGGAGPDSEVPQRCVDSTVTAVSCAAPDVRDNLLPHPDDCELFYYCVSSDSKPVCRQCNSGLHFNPKLRVCDVPERAGCAGEAPEPEPPAEGGAPACPAGAAASPVSCADAAGDGLMAHPDDCGLYYQCVGPDAAPQCRPCGAGLHFNPELRVCDAPAQAGCVSAPAYADFSVRFV